MRFLRRDSDWLRPTRSREQHLFFSPCFSLNRVRSRHPAFMCFAYLVAAGLRSVTSEKSSAREIRLKIGFRVESAALKGGRFEHHTLKGIWKASQSLRQPPKASPD